MLARAPVEIFFGFLSRKIILVHSFIFMIIIVNIGFPLVNVQMIMGSELPSIKLGLKPFWHGRAEVVLVVKIPGSWLTIRNRPTLIKT